MFWIYFIFLFGLVSLAGFFLSEGAEEIAERYGANFTGSVVLGLVTSIPEYLFVFWASLKGNYTVALGSAVGAATMLITLGYGVIIIGATTRISKNPVNTIHLSKKTQIDAIYLLSTALVAFVLAYIGDGWNVVDGLIMLGMFIMYVLHHYVDMRRDQHTREHAPRINLKKSALFIVLGGGIILFISEPFVNAIIEVATRIGVAPLVIAILVGPFASEFPEKLAAFLTVRKSGTLAEISICNFIGSKINHNSILLAMIPLIAFFKGKGTVSGIISPPFVAMTALTVFAALSLARRKLVLWQGFLFVLLFGVIIIVAMTSGGVSVHSQ